LYDRVGSDPVAEVWHKNWTTAPKKALNPAGMPTSLDHRGRNPEKHLRHISWKS